MKITVEPTAERPMHHTVSVSTPHDELTVEQAAELIATALRAFGFHDESVRKFLQEVECG